MSKTWKWILGIFIVLVVVAALVAVPFVMRGYMLANFAPNNSANTVPGQGNNVPLMPGNPGWQHPRMQGGGNGDFNFRSGPMMGGRGYERGFGFNSRFSPFGFGFMAIGGILRLIPLALFALLLYGVYQLGRRSGLRSNQVVIPAASSAPSAAAPVEETPENNDTPSI